MRTGRHWLDEHQWGSPLLHPRWAGAVSLLKGMWLWALFLVVGVVVVVTSVILAYPVVAHVAARFFQ